MTTNPFDIHHSPASVRLAKDIIGIASNPEYENLRQDMIESLIMREVFGHPDRNSLEVAVSALTFVALTVEVLADDIAETAAAHARAQEVADDPRFKGRLEAMAREMNQSTTKPLRRLAIVDESFREMDQ